MSVKPVSTSWNIRIIVLPRKPSAPLLMTIPGKILPPHSNLQHGIILTPRKWRTLIHKKSADNLKNFFFHSCELHLDLLIQELDIISQLWAFRLSGQAHTHARSINANWTTKTEQSNPLGRILLCRSSYSSAPSLKEIIRWCQENPPPRQDYIQPLEPYSPTFTQTFSFTGIPKCLTLPNWTVFVPRKQHTLCTIFAAKIPDDVIKTMQHCRLLLGKITQFDTKTQYSDKKKINDCPWRLFATKLDLAMKVQFTTIMLH